MAVIHVLMNSSGSLWKPITLFSPGSAHLLTPRVATPYLLWGEGSRAKTFPRCFSQQPDGKGTWRARCTGASSSLDDETLVARPLSTNHPGCHFQSPDRQSFLPPSLTGHHAKKNVNPRDETSHKPATQKFTAFGAQVNEP